MSDLLELRSATAAVVVDVANGGRIASLQIDGVELIVERTEEAVTWGSYPMVPFAGRIDEGRFTFDDIAYEIPKNHPPHAMHGYGLFSAWDQVDANTIRFELGDPWPFAGTVEQCFELTDTRLVQTMTATAIDRQPMQFGWHPWWLRSTDAGELELEFSATSMYRRGENGLPDGTLITPPPGPWDDCFADLDANPILRWGELEVTLSSSADHWVVYDEPTHALCVEPQTGPPNMINDQPLVLDPGQSLTHTFTADWSATFARLGMPRPDR